LHGFSIAFANAFVRCKNILHLTWFC